MAEDAEVDENEDEDGEEKPKKSKKKLLLFVGLPVVIVLLVAIGVGLMLMGGGDEEVVLDEDGKPVNVSESTESKMASGPVPIFYQMPEILVNISGEEEGEQLILQINIQLEVPDEETIHQLDLLLPRVVDQYQSFLRELRVEDIKGSAGNYRLRLELLRRVNLAMQPAYVNDVLIEKLLVN
ncbi:MAG: flagellar basal body-associated FliL family protein [Robiginitomaculum sp.]|nr:flagellar basal body-associated FliL family protein [Robiginitomaculum sp.]